MSREFRINVLKHMGSQIATGWDHMNRKLPKEWQRLYKTPSNICLLKYKCFSATEGYFPNMRRVKTLSVMRKIKIK